MPAPDLIGRALTAVKPNQKRWGDITCVKTWDGWAYLATVIDLQSRAVVGWAITHRRPPQGVVFHSDRGRQHTSRESATYCKRRKLRRSLGRTGICDANAVAESYFARYRKELIYTRPWPDITSLKKKTSTRIQEYYNRPRRHSTLGYLTPAEYELGYKNIHELAA